MLKHVLAALVSASLVTAVPLNYAQAQPTSQDDAKAKADKAAAAAEEAFDRVHVLGGVPDEVAEVVWPESEPSVHLPALLARAFGVSTSEARRSLAQNGVRLDGMPLANGELDLPASELDGRVLQLGKRRFARVRVG